MPEVYGGRGRLHATDRRDRRRSSSSRRQRRPGRTSLRPSDLLAAYATLRLPPLNGRSDVSLLQRACQARGHRLQALRAGPAGLLQTTGPGGQNDELHRLPHPDCGRLRDRDRGLRDLSPDSPLGVQLISVPIHTRLRVLWASGSGQPSCWVRLLVLRPAGGGRSVVQRPGLAGVPRRQSQQMESQPIANGPRGNAPARPRREEVGPGPPVARPSDGSHGHRLEPPVLAVRLPPTLVRARGWASFTAPSLILGEYRLARQHGAPGRGSPAFRPTCASLRSFLGLIKTRSLSRG
jgi:hypothetical protein